MSLSFPYEQWNIGHPIWPLFNRCERPRPMIHVSLIGPSATRLRPAWLDTGADDTVFPESLAAQLGIDLSNAPTGGAAGIGGTAATLRYAEVKLRMSDGKEFREWPARVGFTASPLRRALLGFAGFLQFFTATFHGELEKVELTINNLYPGV
jgi:hypothetical protein